jgi:hypothetical protein
LWGELNGASAAPNEPLAPTLARHARPSEYLIKTYPDLKQAAAERLRLGAVEASEPVELIEPHAPMDELVATLLYRVTVYPYRQILAVVREWTEKEKEDVIEIALRRRGPHDELLQEFRCGYGFIFDVLMDLGGWRDLHRHRRCQQIRQEFTTVHGYETPALLQDSGVAAEYRAVMDEVKEQVEGLALSHGDIATYLTPFGCRTRCLFKMDYAEAEYMARLRSGVKGHFSYRTIAWLMQRAVLARYPALGSRISATPPDIEDSLTR